MRHTISSSSEQLQVRVRDLERENSALGGKLAELQRHVRRLEIEARPLNVRLARLLHAG